MRSRLCALVLLLCIISSTMLVTAKGGNGNGGVAGYITVITPPRVELGEVVTLHIAAGNLGVIELNVSVVSPLGNEVFRTSFFVTGNVSQPTAVNVELNITWRTGTYLIEARPVLQDRPIGRASFVAERGAAVWLDFFFGLTESQRKAAERSDERRATQEWFFVGITMFALALLYLMAQHKFARTMKTMSWVDPPRRVVGRLFNVDRSPRIEARGGASPYVVARARYDELEHELRKAEKELLPYDQKAANVLGIVNEMVHIRKSIEQAEKSTGISRIVPLTGEKLKKINEPEVDDEETEDSDEDEDEEDGREGEGEAREAGERTESS